MAYDGSLPWGDGGIYLPGGNLVPKGIAGTGASAAMTLGHEYGLSEALVRPAPPHKSFIERTQHRRVAGDGLGWNLLVWNYATEEMVVSPYKPGPGQFQFNLNTDSAGGQFLYDYTAAAFTEATYNLKRAL